MFARSIALLISLFAATPAWAVCADWLLPKIEAEHIPTFRVGAKPVFESEHLLIRSYDPKKDRRQDLDEWIHGEDIQRDLKFDQHAQGYRTAYREFVKRASLGVYLLRHFPEWLYLEQVIIEKSSGRIIGSFLICEQNNWTFATGNFSMVEIGFSLSPAARGKRYEEEASRAVIDTLEAHFPARYIYGLVRYNNEGSIKTLERLGMFHWKDDDRLGGHYFVRGGPQTTSGE